jgi:hypothetical protein
VLLQRALLQISLLKEAILDDMKIKFQYNSKQNLIGGDYIVRTRRSDNLPPHIKGKAIYHEWQHAAANCYEVAYGGQTRDIEFINRHWYWINWDKDRGVDGAYTINPAYNFILAPKEYGLGTEEDHYCEKGKTTSDKESKDKENLGSDDGTSTDNDQTPAANSPVRELTRSLAEYIAKKDTEELVEAIASLMISTPLTTTMFGSVTIA